MDVKVAIFLLLLIPVFGCKENEVVLPERTAFGMLNIDGREYPVQYGVLGHFGPFEDGSHNHSLSISDAPIFGVEGEQSIPTTDALFSMIITFITYDDELETNEYEYWPSRTNNSKPFWWTVHQIQIPGKPINHPNSGRIAISRLGGNYSFILDLNTDNDPNLATVQGTIYGKFDSTVK